MKKSIIAVIACSLAFAGFSYFKSNNVNEIVSQNIEALTYVLDPIDIYPSADGYYYTSMYYKDQYGSNGIYGDVTDYDSQTEIPYKMMDDDGHIAYKCSTWRPKVGSSERGHCFNW